MYQVMASFGYLWTKLPVVGPGASQHQSKGHTLPCQVEGTSAVLFAFSLPRGSIMLSRLRVVLLAVKGGGVKARYRPLPGCDSEKLGLCLAVSVRS